MQQFNVKIPLSNRRGRYLHMDKQRSGILLGGCLYFFFKGNTPPDCEPLRYCNSGFREWNHGEMQIPHRISDSSQWLECFESIRSQDSSTVPFCKLQYL